MDGTVERGALCDYGLQHLLHQLDDIKESFTAAAVHLIQSDAEEQLSLFSGIPKSQQTGDLAGIKLAHCFPVLTSTTQQRLGGQVRSRKCAQAGTGQSHVGRS